MYLYRGLTKLIYAISSKNLYAKDINIYILRFSNNLKIITLYPLDRLLSLSIVLYNRLT
ncbi:conserved hypothetical protein [Xenorhabdus bovienii str. puntauvense]|uniref:Uncharacterized protein n=1 Tax=Xenorhabdus bovienii str. puntauvense TaxID=1398201 RepID=A0A077NKT3_XENBV|nr:conserved hypothetical protein [Xenorhabdus bovienii str. puntauvense]